jgi:hypothetical protein
LRQVIKAAVLADKEAILTLSGKHFGDLAIILSKKTNFFIGQLEGLLIRLR